MAARIEDVLCAEVVEQDPGGAPVAASASKTVRPAPRSAGAAADPAGPPADDHHVVRGLGGRADGVVCRHEGPR
ncbi:hypothetical protein ABT093_16415 [Kitasatospora sp. NPDC002551]|uniref:hypothetical protein n=1 Tax=Kitasatospora sp. NPDC002551 TaxID=3154539 RepID=UPI003322CEC2